MEVLANIDNPKITASNASLRRAAVGVAVVVIILVLL
jgi:hypothetical protein